MECEHCGIGEHTESTRCGVCGWPGAPIQRDYVWAGYADSSPDGRRLESDPLNHAIRQRQIEQGKR